MTVKLMDNPGKADDGIRRETAINTVSEKEGWYPASLWYVPPAERWISVKERLPDKRGKYLVYGYLPLSNLNVFEIATYENDGKWWTAARTEIITHWMPLPGPPKQKEDDKE